MACTYFGEQYLTTRRSEGVTPFCCEVPDAGTNYVLVLSVLGHSNGSRGGYRASWTQLAGMTVARSMHGCVALDGKLYAVGGAGATHHALDTAEVYDPQADGWQPLAKMITARYALGLAAVGGKVYAMGGMDDGDSILESVEAYDP